MTCLCVLCCAGKEGKVLLVSDNSIEGRKLLACLLSLRSFHSCGHHMQIIVPFLQMQITSNGATSLHFALINEMQFVFVAAANCAEILLLSCSMAFVNSASINQVNRNECL